MIEQITNSTVSKGLPGEEKPAYEYDTNNRLTKGAGVAYEYDAANNPTKLATNTYKYSNDDELESATGLTYSYSEDGQRTKTTPISGPASTYSYDQAGNLISIERPEKESTPKIEDAYAYNGEALRASQTISGTTTYMAWDIADELPLLLSDGTNSYIYGPGGLPIEQINNTTGVATYLHHDQAGSTRLLTGSTGKVEGSYTYGPYGETTGHTGTATTPLGYDGQYTSADTGLIYLRNRVYDPFSESFWTEGNFISESPLNPIIHYDTAVESYENRSEYFASVAHGLEGAIAGTALFAGGEGADDADSAVADITFGHGTRHLIGTGLDSGEVESAIQSQIDESSAKASATRSLLGKTVVDGQTVEYRAYTLPNGTINVGTYYVSP